MGIAIGVRRCLVASVLLVMGAGLLGAPIAWAHGDIQEMRPPEGSRRDAPVRHVRITFTEAPTEDSVIDVTDGCGRDVVREQYVEGRTKHVFLRARRAVPGEWTVSYRVVSAEDGHQTRGSYNFVVRGETDCSEPADEDPPGDDEAPGDADGDVAAPGGSTGADEDRDFPLMPALVGGVILVGLAAAVRLAANKR
jgi:methionine-rich copper-binding protein CopC